MRYGAVIAVTGTSGKAARIRELSGGAFIGMEERIIVNFRSAGISDIVVVCGAQKKLVRRLQNRLQYLLLCSILRRENLPQRKMLQRKEHRRLLRV